MDSSAPIRNPSSTRLHPRESLLYERFDVHKSIPPPARYHRGIVGSTLLGDPTCRLRSTSDLSFPVRWRRKGRHPEHAATDVGRSIPAEAHSSRDDCVCWGAAVLLLPGRPSAWTELGNSSCRQAA